MLVNNGVMSKKKFMTDKLGYTEEEAAAELEEIRSESSVSADIFDMFPTGEKMDPKAEPQAMEEDEQAAEDES